MVDPTARAVLIHEEGGHVQEGGVVNALDDLWQGMGL